MIEAGFVLFMENHFGRKPNMSEGKDRDLYSAWKHGRDHEDVVFEKVTETDDKWAKSKSLGAYEVDMDSMLKDTKNLRSDFQK
jgi:hypothetical protein